MAGQSRYKKIFTDRWAQNKELFEKFFMLNSLYNEPAKRKKIEDDFQEIGEKVKKHLKEGENELCGSMEKGNNNKYSTHLSEKYWTEVRKYFKFIDKVGVKTL